MSAHKQSAASIPSTQCNALKGRGTCQLPLFLRAISWNVDEVTSDSVVAAEGTALMKSKELPGIRAHW